MVWFQCEDCGENLKKPKLPNHFRMCSATKLSCIDCGVVFTQDSVQYHVQCISEAEKYGPKGQVKPSNEHIQKSAKKSKQDPDFDLTVGLSQRPPWFCSLCNTSATSKQTLMGHAEGKKHRAKARAYHSANQQTKDADNPINNLHFEHTIENGEVKSTNTSGESEKCGEVCVDDGISKTLKKITSKGGESAHKIKWKKLIKTALKTNSEGSMKIKKLKKIVLKSMKVSSSLENEAEISEILAQKINSCSRFQLDGKIVRLVAKV